MFIKAITGCWIIAGLFAVLSLASFTAHAIESQASQQLMGLAQAGTSEKIELISLLAKSGDTKLIPLLEALQQGNLYAAKDGTLVIVTPAATLNAQTLQPLGANPADLEKISINNRLRRSLDSGLATLKLSSTDSAVRLAAAQELEKRSDDNLLPLIDAALAKENDAAVKASLLLSKASIDLKNPDASVRLAAVSNLAESGQAKTKSLLAAFLENNAQGQPVEPDAAVRAAVKTAIAAIDSELAKAELIGNIFSGVSLGSILLLAALGLAITFGLMGIINMAHGELLMIGAYATYVVQTLFQTYLPKLFDWYLLLAIPVSFLAAALVGMALERSVIRYLYGRPLETLLATWGISLLLIQTVRIIFGAQNVTVASPDWMSGGLPLMSGLVLPYNRIAIILFALIVVALMWFLLNRTRLGLFVRAVTQNRSMAECVGVPTRNIDLWTFGLGSGIAGLGGCALSQIGNVGPELGQSYIVDSFLVVVLGGVGQLAGTVFAALGLGSVAKFLEPYTGAVLAKILLLVFIIIFIQKRPQGLFALKGRQVEN